MGSLDPVDRSGVAVADDVTIWIVESAIETVIESRLGPVERDVLTVLAALGSIGLETRSMLREFVADAREAGFTWEAIAARLDLDMSTARCRFGSCAAPDGLQVASKTIRHNPAMTESLPGREASRAPSKTCPRHRMVVLTGESRERL